MVIGDLHGCYDEAVELLDRVAVTSSDRVIFVGDLVDRGPKPRECVELAMRHEAIRGNHEVKHLQQRRRRDADLLPDHLRTRQALAPAHYAYFEGLPDLIRLPEYGAAVVHAGAFPEVPLEAQEAHHLHHLQCIAPPIRKSHWPSKAPAEATFWTNHWSCPERLIFGHTVLDRPLVTPHAVGIDTRPRRTPPQPRTGREVPPAWRGSRVLVSPPCSCRWPPEKARVQESAPGGNADTALWIQHCR